MTYRKLALLPLLACVLIAGQALAAAPAFKSAVSRRLHNGVAFDIPLPQGGAGGIECRMLSQGITLIVNFDQAVSGANAAVTAGTATVSGVTASGNAITVALTNVGNAQALTVALTNVAPAAGGTAGSATVNFRVLEGDCNGNGMVTVADVNMSKFYSGKAVDGSNFRCDLNCNGIMTVADVNLAKYDSGKSVAGGASQNTPPTIAAISAQATTTGTAATVPVTVGDAESDPATLDVKANSDNQTLLPNASITVGGSGANRTLTLTPASGQTGTANVTLTVSDGLAITTATFALTVNPSVGNGGGGTATLFIATMRPQSGAVSSGSGSAVLQLSADSTYATLRFSYSNMTSPKVSEHIHGPGDANTNAGILFDIDTTTPAADGSYKWVFAPTGGLSVSDQITAIRSGLTYINIHSAQYPSGEIRGQFIAAQGSQTFTPPPPPPTLSGGLPSQNDAVRFLRQASYGPNINDVNYVTANGFDAWLNNQFSLPASSMYQTLTNWQNQGQAIYKDQMWSSWWYLANTSPDQLRQRVAFSLNELFVVSINSSDLDSKLFAMATYYDTLAKDAFGNYRQILNDMTLNPAMGLYLTMLGNKKANPAAGTLPNENYAREIMQLFSIGVQTLQPDGTLKLDANGLPIPTYLQADVMGLARVFTGWNWNQTGTITEYPIPNGDLPMTLIPADHETGTKTFLGTTIPANQDGNVDLQQALDVIFNHPNVGPFVARQLIEKLVTSNPSPAYVYRVAQVFNNNGSGVRGDMKAVIRAVLTDYEARSSTMLTQQGFGKLNEPMLRVTQVMRAFNAYSSGAQHMWYLDITDDDLDQSAMHAPSVFNFYMPGFIQPGQLAAAGMVAPEFQITTETTTMTVQNFMRNGIYGGFKWGDIKCDYNAAGLYALASNPTALVDRVILLLCAGNMNATVRTNIITQVTNWPASDTFGRCCLAVHLVSVSPDAAVQK
jgi:uncharacterized protein (DUF1800 family)